MSPPRVFVMCPDYEASSGGVRRLYRHVDVLRRLGTEAWLLHQKPGFRCVWFQNETPVTTPDRHLVAPNDYLVVPENYGPGIAKLAPGVTKVIFNQNSYLTLQGFPPGSDPSATYLGPEVAAVFAVSEDNAAYLRYAFPGLAVHRLHYGIDPLFAPRPKRRAITFMPRKSAGDAGQVLAILGGRGALRGWSVEPLDGLPEVVVARRLGECLIFLSLGTAEGCPLPPQEALGRLAEAFVCGQYSPEREARNIVEAWTAVGENCRRPVLPG